MRYNTYTDLERKSPVLSRVSVQFRKCPCRVIHLCEARSDGYTSLHSLHIGHLDMQTHRCEANTERQLYRKRMIFQPL